MPIYALHIIAFATKLAGRHTAYILERCRFVLIRFVVVIVSTWVVGTITS